MVISNSVLDEAGNEFVINKEIPLGINTWRGNKPYGQKKKIVTLPYKKNGSLIIVGGSGWGKSVLLKRVLDYELVLFAKSRPALIIDTQGVDHRLLKYPNMKYGPLFRNYGEHPASMKNTINYCPVFASNLKYEGDKVWGISLNDLDSLDMRSSQLSLPSVTEFFKIKQYTQTNREMMDNPAAFYKAFSTIPSSKIDFREDEDYGGIAYPGLINYGMKQALLNNFSWWAGYEPDESEKRSYESDQMFAMKRRPPYFISTKDPRYKATFHTDYDAKKTVINNFMEARQEREAMSIYGGYLLRDAYAYCRMRKKELGDSFAGLLATIEEANMFIHEKDELKGCNYYLTEMLCRGFKYELKVVANFQNISGVNRDIKEHMTNGLHPVIIGKLTMSDREFLSGIFPGVKDLDLKDKKALEDEGYGWGGNEWAVYYNDQIYDTFVPYPSLSKLHERG